MLTFFFCIIFALWLIASVVLVLVVLVQSGKGGGLSGLVGAGTSLGDSLGATGAEKTLNRWTTYCAIGFLILNIALVFMAPKVFNNTAWERSKAKAKTAAAATATKAPVTADIPATGKPDVEEKTATTPAATTEATPQATTPAAEQSAPTPAATTPSAPATAATVTPDVAKPAPTAAPAAAATKPAKK